MVRIALALLFIGYLPGAIIFRLPIADRAKRAALAADERLFWSVVISAAWSSAAVLGLAAFGEYAFERLLALNGAMCALLLIAVRGRARLGRSAPWPTWTAIVPVALAAAGFFINFHVPPSEYIIGGRDPGVYINEGIQIAQRGSLTTADGVAASVPESARDLFFPKSSDPSYYSNRFMGFFLLNPDNGAVVGQFPHLFPAWLAIGYGINGLTGVRWVSGLAAILGLLAVYFAGARVAGRAAAAAGAGLLAVHVVQIWYARYPNAEIVMQPLVFAGVLAFARAHADDDRFFGPVAAALLTLAAFAHLTGVIAIAAMVAAAVLERVQGRRARLEFTVPVLAGTALATAYLVTVLPPYFQVPLGFVRNLQAIHLVLLAVLAIAAAAALRGSTVPAITVQARRWIAIALGAGIWIGAIYAYVFRAPGGRLAPHDADALRTFTAFYLTPAGLAASLAGVAILARRGALTSPLLLLTATFSFLFFYKIRIVPEHFWASRRFLAIILPSALLMAGAAAFTGTPAAQRFRIARYGVGVVLVAWLGWHFTTASRPILRHVEYAGLIPHVEQLAGMFGPDDLVLVESRGASDVHVLALPLAYIYDRSILVFATITPDKRAFREFLEWARTRYARIFFLGGGGTELLSRSTPVKSIGGERFQVPEYESAWNAYPRGPRFKEFDFGIYEFIGEAASERDFTLNIGSADDLYVRRFHAKERQPDASTFRWTRDVSYASILGTAPHHRTLTLFLDKGGRPASAGTAGIEVFLNEQRLGAATVDRRGPYRFAIPAAVAATMAASEEAAQLRIVSSTWNPARALGGSDSRDIGVMMERIEIR